MNERYKMLVDLNVLEHLGINLYSNVAAVLTEAVANAWDADASTVNVVFRPDDDRIEIVDDGIGMSVEDMNRKYLRVGYRRRDEAEAGARTAGGRAVMGRKGLGKLSLFSVAEIVELSSVKDGHAHGLRMTVEGIRDSVRDKLPHYTPEPLRDADAAIDRGTRIILGGLRRGRIDLTVTALRKRLSRRFSVVGQSKGFEVSIDGVPITTADRGDLETVQFLWSFDGPVELPASAEVKEERVLSHRLDQWRPTWRVGGWIGTARKPKQLDSEEAGNLNGIVVFARGRLIHENLLDKVNDGRLYTKYITGQIEADFLDRDDEPDIATSDRQRLQESDPRYVQLMSFVKKTLTEIESQWTELRQKYELDVATRARPALLEWLDSLPTGYRRNAEQLLAKLVSLPLDKEGDRKLLLQHGILAFERLRLRGGVERLVERLENVDELLSLLADKDSLEASLYLDIVNSRLEVIKAFESIVDNNQLEKVVQRYLFEHMWLLDPSWERATGSEIVEKGLVREGVIVEDLTEKEKRGRVDIAYRTNAGKHVIVELKRPGRKMKLGELIEQGSKYVDALRKVLRSTSQPTENVEVVFVIGQPLDEESTNPDRLGHAMATISPGSRVVHYDSLIAGALAGYSEYQHKYKELGRISTIVDAV